MFDKFQGTPLNKDRLDIRTWPDGFGLLSDVCVGIMVVLFYKCEFEIHLIQLND